MRFVQSSVTLQEHFSDAVQAKLRAVYRKFSALRVARAAQAVYMKILALSQWV